MDLTRIKSRSGAPFTVGGAYAQRFQGLLHDLEDAGYAIHANQSGGYNPRNIRGTNTPSQHSFGRAIDINWTDNPRGAQGKIPADLARDLAKKHGLTWGGDWKNPDPMHFEVARDGPVPMAERGLVSFAGLGGPKPAPSPSQPETPAMPRLMGNMQNAGGPGLIDALMNPMTMAGLSILGSPTRDVSQGMQVGMNAQMQGAKMDELRRQRAMEEQQRANLMGLLADPEIARSLPAGAARIAEAAGPELGLQFLTQQLYPKPPTPTDDQREYAHAREQGYKGSFMDYLEQVKGFSRAQTNINMPPMEKEYDKTMGGELAKEFIEANKTAANAQRDIASLNTMRQALDDPNLYTGTGGGAINAAKRAAETLFGVPVKGTASAEIMQNLASEIAVSNRHKLPGPMSNSDRQFLEDMAPNLTKTPEGNRLLIELAMEDKQWQIARAEAIRAYAARNGGRLDANYHSALAEIDQDYAQKSATIMQRLRGLGEMAPRSPAAGVPNVYKQKYGLE